MVLEAAAALGVASSICQLIDFTGKLISTTHENYRDGRGSSVKRLELETTAETICMLSRGVSASMKGMSGSKTSTNEETQLQRICDDVTKLSSEMLEVLNKVTVTSSNQAWASFREALNLLWNEDKIDNILSRLKLYRQDIDTFILVLLRRQVDFLTDVNRTMSSQLRSLDLKQSSMSKQVTEYFITDAKWKSDLIETVYRENWTPYSADNRLDERNIAHLSDALSSAASRERKTYLTRKLIARLQFPEIRDRLNRIPSAHARTFRWVFEHAASKAERDTSAHIPNIEGPDPGWLNPGASKSSLTGSQSETGWQPLSSPTLQRPAKAHGQLGKWLEEGTGIFWIYGKPASGKSTLMKYVKDNPETPNLLRKWGGSTRHVIFCSYFFWKAGQEIQKTQLGLLRTILYDAVRQMPALVPTVFAERWSSFDIFGDAIRPWTWPELAAAFLRLQGLLCDRNDIRLFLMIDGLDECQDNYAELVQLLRDASSTPHTKLLLGSRPEQSFQDAFGECPSLRLQDLTLPDIIAYVDTELHTQPRFQRLKLDSPDYAVFLVDSIARKASGVFLWVRMVVRSLIEGLQNGDRISEMDQRLAKIPPELDDLYASLLKSLQPQYLKDASHMFQMMRSAPGQLNLLDFSFADEDESQLFSDGNVAALDADEVAWRHDCLSRRLNSRCKGLLEISSITLKEDSPPKDVTQKATTGEPVPTEAGVSTQRLGAQDGVNPPVAIQPKGHGSPSDVNQNGPPSKNVQYKSDCKQQETPPSWGQSTKNNDGFWYDPLRSSKAHYYFSDSWRMKRPRKHDHSSNNETLPVFRDGDDRALLVDTDRTDVLHAFNILEVDYLHRTAKDFLDREENWRMLMNASDPDYSAQAALLRSCVLLIKRIPRSGLTTVSFWSFVRWCARCVVQMESSGQTVDAEVMDAMDKALSWLANLKNDAGFSLVDEHNTHLEQMSGNHASCGTKERQQRTAYHWANLEPGRRGLGATFITFCLENDLSSFVKYAVRHMPLQAAQDGIGRPILDYIWIGRAWGRRHSGRSAISETTTSVRLSDALPSGMRQNPDSDHEYLSCSPPSLKTASVLLNAGADPNQWYANGTPWMRVLSKMYEFYLHASSIHDSQAPGFEKWYDIFTIFIECGADPKADMDCPGGTGSYAREIFQSWNTEKTIRLQRLMKKKQRRLPQLKQKLLG